MHRGAVLPSLERMNRQMSNRNALRKLSRKFPAPPEVEKIMDSLREGTDLSIAITATAILEATLERLLIKKFKIKNKRLTGQIFLNRGPLSEFNSKILIANAFGIITSNMAEEMHSLKAIRNTFAHAKVPISFNHELIGREVASLKMLKASRAVDDEIGHYLELDNKNWFLLVTKFILIIFSDLEEHPGSADEAIAEALAEEQPPASPY